MSRKDYKAIANVLSDTVPDHLKDLPFYFDLIHELCVIFEDDNSRFDSDKFKEVVMENIPAFDSSFSPDNR